MIGNLFTDTVAVSRLADIGGTNRRQFTTLIASLPCLVQPVDETITQDIAGSFGKDWLLMSNLADIQEGDRVTWNGGEYRVRSVVQHTFLNESHLEAIIRIFES